MTEYEDIIGLPHKTSKKHPKMSLYDRAAQFAAFQALNGYGEAINETGRTVDKKIELSEYEIDMLNSKINYLNDHIKEHPKVMITYFKEDLTKNGGKYEIITSNIRRIDMTNRVIVLEDRTSINIDNISKILSGDYEIVDINY